MKKKSGFTLIEVLIAIGVFSVGVLAVLNLVVHNLSTLDKTEVKTMATLFAKEGIALAFHVRDANLAKELPWNCIFSNELYEQNSNFDFETQVADTLEEVVCKGYFGVGDKALYQIMLDLENYYTIQSFSYEEDFDMLFTNHQLFTYLDKERNVSWYGNKGEQVGEESFFARYLEFAPIKEGDNNLPSEKILKVISHVLYKKGGLTGEILLESFIGDH